METIMQTTMLIYPLNKKETTTTFTTIPNGKVSQKLPDWSIKRLISRIKQRFNDTISQKNRTADKVGWFRKKGKIGFWKKKREPIFDIEQQDDLEEDFEDDNAKEQLPAPRSKGG